MTHWVHDKETVSNFFCEVFEDYKTETEKVFIIHQSRNDLPQLLEFYEQNIKLKEMHISFNGISFDSQISMFILKNADILLEMSAEEVAKSIYRKAQDCINRSKKQEWQEFNEKDIPIKQLDLFTLNGWDGAQRRASLKKLQFSMNWPNIQEMPIPHNTHIVNQDQIATIVNYCRNDVKSTKQIMRLSKEGISLRKSLSKEYDLNLLSHSEPRLSKALFLKFLCEKTRIPERDMKRGQTIREKIKVKDIIFPYIRYKSKEFKSLLERFQNQIIDGTQDIKGAIHDSVKYKGVTATLGAGGLHGANKAGIYESKEGMLIIDSDLISFYPNLSIRNKTFPAHLPKKEFLELYQWFFEERIKIPKKDPKNTGFKLILNSTVGLTAEKNSFLRDIQFFLQITINGQLSLLMFFEQVCDEIPGAIPLMLNTDGITMMIPINYKEKYLEIAANFEKVSKLQWEHVDYKKVILADVNSYIAIPKSGKVKYKGRFEYEPFDKFETTHLHKDRSGLIVPKALSAFFLQNKQPEEFLKENRNIYDYCIGKRIKGDWQFEQTCVINRKIEYVKLQDTIRYYIAKKGCTIVKKNIKDGRKLQVEAGWQQELFNIYEQKKWEDYNVNDTYYLAEIYKEINRIIPKKEKSEFTLFS